MSIEKEVKEFTKLAVRKDQASGEVYHTWLRLRDSIETERNEMIRAIIPLVNAYAWSGGPEDGIMDDEEIDCCVTITHSDVARARAAFEDAISALDNRPQMV